MSELVNTCYRCGRPTVSHLCDECTIPGGGNRNGELAKAPADLCACCERVRGAMAWPCPLLVVRRGTGQRMISSADLESEVLKRLALLAERKGPRASATASIVANLGEKRSTGAVSRALFDLWEQGEVEWCGEETFRLVVRWQPPAAEQMGLEVEA